MPPMYPLYYIDPQLIEPEPTIYQPYQLPKEEEKKEEKNEIKVQAPQVPAPKEDGVIEKTASSQPKEPAQNERKEAPIEHKELAKDETRERRREIHKNGTKYRPKDPSKVKSEQLKEESKKKEELAKDVEEEVKKPETKEDQLENQSEDKKDDAASLDSKSNGHIIL